MTDLLKDAVVEQVVAGQGARLRAIRLKALADSPDAFASTYEQAAAYSAEDWETRLAAPGATFIAVTGGSDVGLVGVYPGEGDTAHLISMWVDPAARGRGAGSLLVDAVLSWTRTAGGRAVELWAVDGNESAIALYRRKGFELTGDRMALPSNPDLMESHYALKLD
jgi:GNAT superfamily N-acetyltransferase